jgi:Family of unknown function (DUF6228)
MFRYVGQAGGGPLMSNVRRLMEKFWFSSDPALKACFCSRRYDGSGWLESYAIELEALDFHASIRIENPGFSQPPTQLFDELATSWAGWEGVKTWLAMEGELELKATCDRIGHVTLAVSIVPYAQSGQWSAQAGVTIEAGQLERLATEARLFFARRDA